MCIRDSLYLYNNTVRDLFLEEASEI